MKLENKIITDIPFPGADGVCVDGFADKKLYMEGCTIDLEKVHPAEQDEIIGITHGATGLVKSCSIRNGKKAILCGSGDIQDERGESPANMVTFKDCVIENFSRRGPEAQNRYLVIMQNCTIRNWGLKKFFDVRAFGAWAHDGGIIIMKDCRFEQFSFWQAGIKNFFMDLANSIGQSWNECGLRGLLDWRTYLPGVCKGAFATDRGYIKLINCTKNKWWIYLENNKNW